MVTDNTRNEYGIRRFLEKELGYTRSGLRAVYDPDEGLALVGPDRGSRLAFRRSVEGTSYPKEKAAPKKKPSKPAPKKVRAAKAGLSPKVAWKRSHRTRNRRPSKAQQRRQDANNRRVWNRLPSLQQRERRWMRNARIRDYRHEKRVRYGPYYRP